MTAYAGTSALAQADPGGPGATVIADRVVERIAAQAVAEVDRATGVARQVLGMSFGSTDEHTRARVSADVDGGVVAVQVGLAVMWPSSITTVTRQVREHVTSRVQQLTGLQVADVDIDVTELLTTTTPPARVQ